MKRILKIFVAVIVTGTIFLVSGCYPDSDISVSQTDLVLTRYNDSVDFTKLSTYYMPDSIFPMTDDTSNIKPVEYQQDYLNEIASNMEKMGYQRITGNDTTQIPDVLLIVSAVEVENISVGWWYPYYPGWGWDWYWYWDPGWGWYYPPYYYPSYPYYSTYKTGTLLLEMMNPKDYDVIDGDTVMRVYWHGALNGVLEGSDIKQRTIKGIDQIFEQSPEIKTGN